jgi:hypothetical protein
VEDFSGLFSGLSVTPGVAAVMGAGALVVAVGFAAWLTDQVASFFDSGDDEEFHEGYGHWCYDAHCSDCGYESDQDDSGHLDHSDSCPLCGADLEIYYREN